ncbi:MAG: hypothetical protein JNM84_28185 [Planctomycetes bacterium]|nr:hypothetical protein [Planctomycetota bacterium]
MNTRYLSLLGALLFALSALGSPAAAQCRSLGPICQLSTSRPPTQRCPVQPQLCSPLPVAFRLEVVGAPISSPALLVLSDARLPGPPIPIAMPPACDLGCALAFLPLAVVPLQTDASGIGSLTVQLPCDRAAVGTSTYTWWAFADPRGCIKFSDVLQVMWM